MQSIIYGDESVISELTYGPRSDGLIQELRSNLGFTNPLLTDQGRNYAQYASQVFETVSGWDAVRAVRKAVQAVSSYIRTDMIIVLDSLDQLQTANPKMQRFIMADIELRKLYQQGRVDGYSESYVDIQPDMIGRNHYDYRVSTHGIVETTEPEEGKLVYEVTQYRMELASWDEELSQRQRIDIARTKSVMRSLLIDGMEEPTSRYGGVL